MNEYIVWPDGVWVSAEDFLESDWYHKSDDCRTVKVPDNVEEDSPEFYSYLDEFYDHVN